MGLVMESELSPPLRFGGMTENRPGGLWDAKLFESQWAKSKRPPRCSCETYVGANHSNDS